MLKRLEVHQFLLILPFEICMHRLLSIILYARILHSCIYVLHLMYSIDIVTNYMIVTVSQSMQIN